MANPITPVTIQGRYFWKGNMRFIISGVVYRSYGLSADMLADDRIEDLEHAIPLLRELGINTLLISYIDVTKSHKACMNLLAEHEIYVLVSIKSVFPVFNHNATMMSYTSKSMQRFFRAVEHLASYPNLLGFTIPNSSIKDLAPAIAGPMVRAIVRDIRRYLGLLAVKKHQRVVPVGLVALDIGLPLRDQFEYWCSGDDNETVDFFIFDFNHPGPKKTTQASRDPGALEIFFNTHIPVSILYSDMHFMPRQFPETRTIYLDPDMRRVFSGGIVFQFFDGSHNNGLVRRLTEAKDGGLYYEKSIDYRNLRDILHVAFVPMPASLIARSRFVEEAAMSGTKPKQPDPNQNVLAIGQVPASPVNWTEVEAQIIDDSEWVDAGKEWLDLTVEDLTASIWDKLNID
ncbi:glycoside hydrolase family 72 protein [Daldinia decipiens]|uniref:glycoside hydrolase family 72 protein n=1 Tax=Daldinia decipiens TaxID=326647 RepID=UPI0020C56B69|nr:glycoside hydrolase family 72 protein [Daldinia decipiens]KAI1659097.1 glycoside hydrolase family 72 protein [Daldinia decipiens]